jgi:hypothetical protein
MSKSPSQIGVKKTLEITCYITVIFLKHTNDLTFSESQYWQKCHKHNINTEHKLKNAFREAQIQHTKLMFAKQTVIYIQYRKKLYEKENDNLKLVILI